MGGKLLFDSRRSEIEIISDILKLSKNGAKKTEILYKGNLSYTLLKNYLSFLLDKNVLEKKIMKNKGGNQFIMYKTTEKGNNLLSDINRTLGHLK